MFAHLHTHTVYSLLDGAIKVTDYVARVKEIGCTAAAVTDHGNMFSVIDFYKECKAQGIKPILGCEVYVAPYGTTRFDRTSNKGENEDARYNHLILFAKSNKGYQNLCKIVSAGWTEGFYYKPRVDMEILEKYHEDVICSSACLAGAIPQALLNGKYDLALKIAREYQEIFGKDDFYIELQDHNLREDKQVTPLLIKLAREIGAKVIATNDAHYLNKEDEEAHDVLLCIQTGKKLADENRMKFETSEFYVKSEEEMRELFSYIPEAIDNTMEIADKCNVEFEFGKIKLPDYEIPKGFKDYYDYFVHLCHDGMIERYGENCPKEYWDRLDYEISIISKMGFIGYYLIVWDFINYAKTHDIPVGPGRGSGAGSIAAYAIKITNIDPMKYGLLFERFLNPERVSMPDFDVDFCYNRRHEVIDYVTRKYGSERVSQIVTFGTMAAKNAIRDVARVMDIPYTETDRIAKMVPEDPKMTIEKALALNPEFKAAYDSEEVTHKVVDMALKVEGNPRHSSKHAAGVLIADKDITDYAPLMTSDGEHVIQFPMTTLEDLGLVKMDFLGLRTLTVIKDAEKAINKKYGVGLNMDKLNIEKYPEVYEMLVKDNTIGVFQFESEGMTSMLKQMFYDIDRVQQAKTEEEKTALGHEFFERLIAGISLYRPGPMDFIPQYIEGIRDPSSIHYDCPQLAPILGKTYGVIVYQEQVQEICRELAGFSYGRADKIRRAMGKKKKYIMDAERQVFLYGNKDTKAEDEAYVPGCIANGIDENAALVIWGKMEEFAKYAFNKSHAASYAVVAFQTAWLKYFYPVEYMAALLTSVTGNKDKLPFYSNACQKTLGIEILKPDINNSNVGFSSVEDKILFGLEGIKAVGSAISEEIVKERDKHGKFTSVFDFAERLSSKGLSKTSMESLIKAGAFDGLGYNRAELLSSNEIILAAAKERTKIKESGQVSLFDFMPDKDALKYPALDRSADLIEDIRLKFEREVTNLYISGNPLSKYSKAIEAVGAMNLREINEKVAAGALHNRDTAYVAVILNNVKRKITKKGTPMMMCSIQDIDFEGSMIAFSQTLESYEFLFKDDSVVMVKATIDCRDDDSVAFIANALYEMPTNTADQESFASFVKDVLPRPKKEKAPVYARSEPVAPKATKTAYKKGLYIRLKERAQLESYVDAVKVAPGQTNVYFYDAATKQILYNPNVKVNINSKELIDTLRAMIDSMDDLKIVR